MKKDKKLDNFKIVLQKPETEVYVPGEPVIGSVKFRVNETFTIESVQLVFIGKSDVVW